MTPEVRADARLETIRQANRRRPVALADAFDLTPSIRRVILREMTPLEDGPLRPADWIKLHVPFSGRGRKHGRAYTIRQRVGEHIVIDMAETVLKFGKDPQNQHFAREIIDTQTREISEMQQWLAQRGIREP